MMDVTSLIRRLHHASPSRRRKVQSMFVDSSNLHTIYPTPSTTTATSSHYHPPPPLSYSPPNYEDDYLHHQPPSLPARPPFSSLPTDTTSPPPLPKRNVPPRNGCSASFSSGHKLIARTSPSPSHLPSVTPSLSSATNALSPPVSTRLAANTTTTIECASSTTRALVSPRRKYSQPFGDIPPTVTNGNSQGNLELCSQSSSSSALHPVSLAAVQRTMANGRRKSSITSNPGDITQPMSLLNVQSSFQKPEDRLRKMSAPVLLPDAPELDEDVRRKLMNGFPNKKSSNSSEVVSNDAASMEAVNEAETDRERKEEEEEKGDSEKQQNCELETAAPGACASADSAISLGHTQKQERSGPLETINDDYDEMISRKATFTFPYSTSPQASGGSTGSCTPPRRTSSPLMVHQRTRGSSSPKTPDLIMSSLSFMPQSQEDHSERIHHHQEEEDNSTGGGLMTGTLVSGAAVGLGSGPPLVNGRDTHRGIGGGGGERRSQRGQRSQSQASNHTNASVRTNSSSDEAESGRNRGMGGASVSAISNPIYVETTEGGREGPRQQVVESHTQHPYEHWATNQQDVANLRLLSQYPWFHGMVSRANASQLVLSDGESGTGQYLVRQSESREGDFVLTFNYHNRAKHLRMAVDDSGCNIQHLWFEDVPSMLDYFKTNSIPLESFWLNDDVKLTRYIDRQASDSFRTTTVVNMDRLARVPPRRSRSLHLGMANSVNSAAANNASNPGTPVPLDTNASSASSSNSTSTNSLPQSARNSTGWRLFRSQRSSSAGNVGRVQRRHSANVGSLLSTGTNSHRSSGRRRRNNNNNENAYIVRNY